MYKKPTTPLILTLLLVMSLVLGACSSANKSASGAGEPDTAGQADAGVSAGTKRVDTVFGEVEIPLQPQRIVALDYLSAVVSLGFKPVGAPQYFIDNPYLGDKTAGIESVGDWDPSMEKIVALSPDLILTFNNDQSAYESYSKIAPTIVVPYNTYKNAHEEIEGLGKMLGREEEAKAWLEEYDRRAEAARAKLNGIIGPEETFTLMSIDEKKMNLFADNYGRGGQAIYNVLQLTPPEIIKNEIFGDTQVKSLSLEAVNQYAGDHIFLAIPKEKMGYQGDKIWQSLEAVKNNRVYELDSDRYYYYDPAAVIGQAEEIADLLVTRNAKQAE
ncbi:iron complex transport system substrate-binding protein [Fontibacillus phaseoli]|uniref:Iron complex transport system substrate-binding protein n=1 Tax=Fontibacillus phaseoli TaxID=1416533 RepID=A0A369B1H8_9BACL|nr:ABC transporter substrate-binding protein [Fontibacillus phaseoli]RCX14428.1 iron complex transport system substrate-binding protein [Fontibacillus phaseoli]